MIEIRWVNDGSENMQLQQRTREIMIDGAGAFCGLTKWSDWHMVPTMDALSPYHRQGSRARVELAPAPLRDYITSKEVVTAWQADEEFVVCDRLHPEFGQYIKRTQKTIGQLYLIRYDNRTKMMTVS